MTVANVSQGNSSGLPPALRTAQDALRNPEVQEMLRRLSEYNLGIFMPHMHDEKTGAFQSLPDEVTQVESGLEVSFRLTQDIAKRTDRFLPVGWFWRAGAATPVAACEMVWQEAHGNTERYVKHQMSAGNQCDA